MIDLSTFFVNQVIVHQVFRVRLAEKDENPPKLSEVPSTLTPRLKSYFRERIIASMRTMHFAAEHDPEVNSPVPALVVEFFENDGSDFVAMSQNVASHLHAVQTGSNSAGVVAVVDGTIGAGTNLGRCLAVLKLEMEGALRIEPATVGGKDTFSLEVEEVTLNEAANVFKAAIFGRAADLASLNATVSDNQRDEARFGPEVASFFLRFLGCRLADTPDRATKEYIAAAEQHINDIPDDEKRFRYEMALLSDLNSQSAQIDPESFAENNLDAEDRDGFVSLFRDDEGTAAVIDKDVALVRSRLRSAQIVYDNGLRLLGPRDAVANSVEIKEGETIVRAEIKSIGRTV